VETIEEGTMSEQGTEAMSAAVESAMAKLNAFMGELPAGERAALLAVFEALAARAPAEGEDVQGFDWHLVLAINPKVRVNLSDLFGGGGTPSGPVVRDHRTVVRDHRTNR
jgi:hypothetical protein